MVDVIALQSGLKYGLLQIYMCMTASTPMGRQDICLSLDIKKSWKKWLYEGAVYMNAKAFTRTPTAERSLRYMSYSFFAIFVPKRVLFRGCLILYRFSFFHFFSLKIIVLISNSVQKLPRWILHRPIEIQWMKHVVIGDILMKNWFWDYTI